MTQQRKPKIDPRSLVAKLSRDGRELLQREIVAPLLPGGKIRTRLNGMVYEFRPRGEFVGWGRFRPLNEREAEVLGDALPWERGAYLELFPLLRVILLWPDTSRTTYPGTWWALPYNASDARQRFGFNAEPLPVFLCDPGNGAERFERVLVRVNGNVLWFEGPDTLADPTHAEWLRDAAAQTDGPETFFPGLAGSERQALLFWQIRQLEIALEPIRRQQAIAERRRVEVERQRREEADRQRFAEVRQRNRLQQQQWLQEQRLRSQLEERLRHALAKADAVLHSYCEVPDRNNSSGNIIVEWSGQGQGYRYRSTVDLGLTVVSSGICLSGRDRDFDLTSLVKVMTDSPSWSHE
jgi:hypothetical protein